MKLPRPVKQILIVVALTLVGSAARAEQHFDLLQGDGRVSEFYKWDGELPSAGQLLRREELPSILALSEAAQSVRILYSSTDGIDGKTPIAVSGALYLPKGSPPAGGWPLIAWAHGTVGVADICAPSWQGRSYRDILYLNSWLSRSYAIVATDYQGLGTPGPHPYLAPRPEAYGVLDSVRAALRATPQLSGKVVIVGQSQGAGAAFATAAFAPQYAPELDIRGTVATGIPYFNESWLASSSSTLSDKVDPTIAYLLYISLFQLQLDPHLATTDLLTEKALPVLEQARSKCIGAVESDVVAAGLTRANSVKALYVQTLRKNLGSFLFPTVKLNQPIFIGTGEEDKDVPPSMQRHLVDDACAAGTLVEAHVYRGLSHSGTVNASLKDSLPFVRKVLQGEEVAKNCTPEPQ
jgi:pimeloyl-ACP methyl ester carboxylesterase